MQGDAENHVQRGHVRDIRPDTARGSTMAQPLSWSSTQDRESDGTERDREMRIVTTRRQRWEFNLAIISSIVTLTLVWHNLIFLIGLAPLALFMDRLIVWGKEYETEK